MSNEVILNLSFDNQTVTDLTGNWTLDGTPNATYEQIDGRDGYSIVTGSLGRCIVLNAVDQNMVYNEYTVDFDMFVKSTYTSDYYFYDIMYMWSRINPGSLYNGQVGNVLNICLKIGGSELAGATDYSPIGRWVHVTITSGPTEVADQYCTTVYADGVKLLDRTDIDVDNNPFALSQQILLLTRDTDAKLMPNGPGICLNTFKVVTGIHMLDQNPAISLFNLNRVFNNFCTWLKRQLSTVALTGSYNDLSDKPTISTVNNGTLTIQKNGTTVDTFTANSSTNKTVNISVPTNTNELTNGAGFITANYAVPRSGGAVMTGNTLSRTINNSELRIDGGTNWNDGASIALTGKNSSRIGGYITLHPSDGSKAKEMFLDSAGTWKWDGTACQITSDQRLKQQIAEIDDKLLDAWEDVEPSQFKYNDAVDQKGKDKARLHTGYVVQQIDSACKSHNVDISQYGLYCHEEYPQETEEVEVEQADGTKTKETKVIREASEHYSLRYTEALIVECAYLRKCIKELRTEIEQLKSSK